MSEVTIADLIGNAAEQQPETFRQSFDALIHDKVVAALDVRKQEVAKTYFASSDDEEELDTEENEDTDGQDAEANS